MAAIVAGSALIWSALSSIHHLVPVHLALPVPPAPTVSASAPAPSASAPPPAPTVASEDDDLYPETLDEQRQRLFRVMRAKFGLGDEEMAAVEGIFAGSTMLGQGNPEVAKHPMTRRECREIREKAGIVDGGDPRCGAEYMVPIYDPTAGETADQAKVCIDQFEFPDIPCEYPVVHVRANEAAMLCRAIGKRICDAHEWEGACAGALKPPEQEYDFNRTRKESSWWHNHDREKVWAYGPTKNHALCATGSFVTPGCPGGGWKECGSNTYPAGSFPLCVSKFGVYDQHGNAAEHMSIPEKPEELSSRSTEAGQTEMKGSWFAFQRTEAHEDDCRWRAPDWHPSRVMNENSHRNYHLGFRCCRDIVPPDASAPASDGG